MELNGAAIRILSGLLEARTGQRLGPGRPARLDAALAPILRLHGIGGFDMLVAALVGARDARLADAVVEALLDKDSRFLSGDASFQTLTGPVLAELAAARGATRRLRVWSAGCSAGQEAYSLAIALADQADRWRGWTIDIQATDVSRAAIAQAREGCYADAEARESLPLRLLERWFDREEGHWRVVPPLRERVRFHVHSLAEPMPMPGTFDVILCRNVLNRFSPAMRDAVLGRLARAIAPDGVLMLGPGEALAARTARFEPDSAVAGFYRLPTTAAGPVSAIPGAA